MEIPMTTPGTLANLVSADEVVTAQQKEIAALKQKNAELAALVAVKDAALRHLHHNAKVSGCEMGLALDVAEEALSITGPAALHEIRAQVIEECAADMVNDSDARWLRSKAAAERAKGENRG